MRKGSVSTSNSPVKEQKRPRRGEESLQANVPRTGPQKRPNLCRTSAGEQDFSGVGGAGERQAVQAEGTDGAGLEVRGQGVRWSRRQGFPRSEPQEKVCMREQQAARVGRVGPLQSLPVTGRI